MKVYNILCYECGVNSLLKKSFKSLNKAIDYLENELDLVRKENCKNLIYVEKVINPYYEEDEPEYEIIECELI